MLSVVEIGAAIGVIMFCRFSCTGAPALEGWRRPQRAIGNSVPAWPEAVSCGGWSSHSQRDRHKKHTRDSLKGRIMEGETTSLVPHHRPESFWDFGGARHEWVGRSGQECGRYLFERVGRRIDVPQPPSPGFLVGASMERQVHPVPP